MSNPAKHSRASHIVLAASFFVSLAAVAADDFVAPATSPTFAIDRPDNAGPATLILAHPNGDHSRIEFAADDALVLDRDTIHSLGLADGQYIWEARFAPASNDRGEPAILISRTDDHAGGIQGPSIEPKSGSFHLSDGQFLQSDTASEPMSVQDDGSRDQVFNDDLIVTGDLCVGVDCASGESFGFDTIRLKTNNLRIGFEDTSVSPHPANDWELTANDSTSGGANRFSIRDVTGASDPFTVAAGAPNNSLYVASTGRIGLRTAAPVLDLHIATGNTPAMRVEQTTAGGFTAQTWDIGANESNFFIRDVTGGSRLPFRIRPGAPMSSIDIAADGDVGIGTASPQAKLHVAGGDVRVDGSVYQLSSRSMKTAFDRLDPGRLLNLVGNLDLGIWRYLDKPGGGSHFGPAAEDFHAAFGLGERDDSISIADMAGIALGATQALKQKLDERDAEIESLRARLERLETMVEGQSGSGVL